MHDPWLERWLKLIEIRANGGAVLEMGCGRGDDTATLVKAGISVNAFDISYVNVAMAKARAPSARIDRRDILSPFPELPLSVGVVIASLSLHYFSWSDTTAVFQRIHECLEPGGLLICRLNSTEDVNFGAKGGVQIEDNFFLVGNQPKRFFDHGSLDTLFVRGWRRLSMEHMSTDKYVKRKRVWELVLEKLV